MKLRDSAPMASMIKSASTATAARILFATNDNRATRLRRDWLEYIVWWQLSEIFHVFAWNKQKRLQKKTKQFSLRQRNAIRLLKSVAVVTCSFSSLLSQFHLY